MADDPHMHQDVKTLGDLNDTLLEEIEHFFVPHNEVRGMQLKPLGRFGTDRAAKLVRGGALRRGAGSTPGDFLAC